MTKEEGMKVQPGARLKIIKSPSYGTQIKEPKPNDPHFVRYMRRGDVITVTRVEDAGRTVNFYFKESPHSHSYVTLGVVEEAEHETSTKDRILKLMESLNTQVEVLYEKQSLLKSKLAYLEETKKTTINNDEFKAWLMLKSLRDNAGESDSKKIEIIAKLMKV